MADSALLQAREVCRVYASVGGCELAAARCAERAVCVESEEDSAGGAEQGDTTVAEELQEGPDGVCELHGAG